MPRRAGLGRGLDALISGEQQENAGGVQYIPVDRIIPNPRQPRSHFDSEELDQLTLSVQEHGILQPLIATVDSQVSDQYILIAGERRWLAARQAGLSTVPVLLREVGERERLELALVENVQRTDLGPLETAEAFRQLVEEFNLTHDQIAARVSKSRSAVSNTIRLLKLPLEVRTALSDAKISEGHARAILTLASPQTQIAALQTIISQELNVRQTEELIQKLSGKRSPKVTKPVIPEVVAIEERLRQHLGTKVRLNLNKGKGTIVIHYYSEEELNALITHLLDEG